MASLEGIEVNTKKKTALQIYTSRPWELLKTGFLVASWIVLGIHGELVGPTLKILALQTDVAFTGISTILVARSGGYITGNIVGGAMKTMVKRYPEVFLAVGFFIPSVGGTTLILAMWDEHASTPLNTVHLGFGFGAALANVLVGRFLGKRQQHELSNSNISSTIRNLSFSSSTNIKIPYSIAAGLCLLIAIGHLIFAICEHRTRRQTLQIKQVNYSVVNTTPVDEVQPDDSENSPQKRNSGSSYYSIVMPILWAAYVFFVTALDQTFGKFFFSYLNSAQFQISTRAASVGMILYWLSYSVS
ncbi:unnamed protein product [Rotaria sp. Silwood1]|nr:unnamed protein product [Rotaria sp. Silwood1]CAF1557849.1 unnamed protein product [Rotaria sp. Silwood1]